MGLDYLIKKHCDCDEESASKIDVQSNLNQTMDETTENETNEFGNRQIKF